MQLNVMCNLFYATTQIYSCMCRIQLNFSYKRQLQNTKILVVWWWFYYICIPIKVVWGMDKAPIFLYCWHVFKAWHLHGIKKIKDVEVWRAILQTFMMWCTCPSIMEKQLMISKSVERLMRESLHKHEPSDVWTNYLWIYYYQFGKW